jgi:hypothetical protein
MITPHKTPTQIGGSRGSRFDFNSRGHRSRAIDAKAIDAALEPEPEHVIHRGAHRWIAPIEIGLLAKEAVQIILPGWRIEGPGRPAELR